MADHLFPIFYPGDVATDMLALGVFPPAQFVATFRAAMGVTPGAVRDALAG